MDQSNQQGSQAQIAARGKLTQIFRYLQALHQWRNPPQREVSDAVLLLWFHDLPIHPCIVRGAIGSADNDIDDGFILKVARPQLTEVPTPPREIQPWLQDGWQNVDSHILVKPSITGTDGRTTRFADDPRRDMLFKERRSKQEKWP